MTQGEGETFSQTGADGQTQGLQPLGTAADAGHQLLQTPLAEVVKLSV